MAGWRPCTAAVLAVALTACANLPPADYGAPASARLPEQVQLGKLPFHPQAEYQCGPAALATVLGAAGVIRRPEDLEKEVYLPGRRGSLQPELLAATRRAGLLAYPLAPRPAALLEEVAAGHPVVVLQDVGLLPWPRWHYAVVAGYDLPGREIMLRSGPEEHLVMSLADFDRTWAPGGRWAFVALPPDRLPATAQAEPYLAAATALEQVAPRAARSAYEAAIGAWPDRLIAWIGLGNAAYRLGDLESAREAYGQAAKRHPGSADAWNNLAQVLLELGQPPEALAAARRAVALGGPRQAIYGSTLAAVEAAMRRTAH